MLNQGWKPVGGINFNAGYPYQALARVVQVANTEGSGGSASNDIEGSKSIGAQDAMRRVDELT